MKQFSIRQFLPRNPIQRDFLVCLIIWFVLAMVCFAIANILPGSSVEIQPQHLFVLSIPLGIGGACLVAASTQITLAARNHSQRQRWLNLGALLLSWLGLFGIGFPLLVLSFRIALWLLMPLRQ